MKNFYPDRFVEKFNQVTVEYLNKNNINGVILDIDNTLVTYDEPVPSEQVISWIKEIQAAKIKVCIVSNGKHNRVDKFNKYLNLPAVYEANKPLKKGFKQAIIIMGIEAENTVILGDQIFTDIYGGNRMNMHTVFVKPISSNEILAIKIKRFLEKGVFWKYNRNLKKRG